MKLDDVLKLRPPAGADTATLAEAVRIAEAKRREMFTQAEQSNAVRQNVLMDDRKLTTAEREAAEAELAVARIDAILPGLRDDLEAARGREVRAALLAKHSELQEKVDEVLRWQEEDYPEIARRIGLGLAAQDALRMAVDRFKANVMAAYEIEAVRNEGALGVLLPELADPLPRDLFREWNI